ncbi:MAG TPA: hypothetical protein VF669_17005 [Tepidisphaeraceae bacterium]|jgi:hypothetical protein
MTEPHNQLPKELSDVQRFALLVSAGGFLICLFGFLFSRQDFFTSYLYAWLFFLGISLGSLALVMLHHLTGGNWGRPIRGILESAMALVPLLAILFLPLLLGLHHLYEWADPDRVAGSEILQHKHAYLNIPFFIIRALIYFSAWSGLAIYMFRAGSRFQEAPSPSLAAQMRSISAPGILFYGISMSFATVDWVMSRETHWYTTILGFIFLCGQALAAIAFAIIILRIIIDLPPIPEHVNSRVLIDLGNLLMTLVILWSYMSFAQFLVQWSGNMRHEVTWYLRRGITWGNGWRVIGILLIVFHFFIPFVLLLFRYNKRHFNILTAIASLVLIMRVVDLYWTVAPSSLQPDRGFYLSWITPFPLLAIGGIWLFCFIVLLRRRPLVSRLEGEPEPILSHGASATPTA